MTATACEGKKLLVISSCGPTKTFAYKRLHELGIHIIVMNPQKADRLEPYVQERIICDIYDHETAIQTLQDYLKAGNTID